jgi:hypothetical protein
MVGRAKARPYTGKDVAGMGEKWELGSVGAKKNAPGRELQGPKDAVRWRKTTVRRAFKAFRFNALT